VRVFSHHVINDTASTCWNYIYHDTIHWSTVVSDYPRLT